MEVLHLLPYYHPITVSDIRQNIYQVYKIHLATGGECAREKTKKHKHIHTCSVLTMNECRSKGFEYKIPGMIFVVESKSPHSVAGQAVFASSPGCKNIHFHLHSTLPLPGRCGWHEKKLGDHFSDLPILPYQPLGG